MHGHGELTAIFVQVVGQHASDATPFPLGDSLDQSLAVMSVLEVARELSSFAAAFYGRNGNTARVVALSWYENPQLNRIEGALYALIITGPAPSTICFAISETHITRVQMRPGQ